jgi:hypothetical protein
MKVFLPWFGHFGDLVRDVLPWIWAQYQPGDIIGGNPLHGLLYPVPPDPRLWAPVQAHYPAGYDYRIRPEDLEERLRVVAQDLWPRADLVTWAPDGEHYPKPPIPLPEQHPVDVVLAPRAKPYEDAKNGWPWAILARSCRERGWIVGLAGSRAESTDVPADVAAWDLDPASDAVTGTLRLLCGARVVVSLDSGIGHLASLVNAPQVVVYPQRGDERRSVVLRDGHPVAMRFADMHRWNQHLCLPAWGGASEVLAAIDEATRARVLPGAIDAWKGRHLAEIPGWSAPEVIVVREADRSLVMRLTGNDLIETASLDDLPLAPSPEEAERRAGCCRACPHYRVGSDQCAMCGCAFVITERVHSRVARCPEGRWP